MFPVLLACFHEKQRPQGVNPTSASAESQGMRIVWSPTQLNHAGAGFVHRGRFRASPEVPERAEFILDAVQAHGHEIQAPHDRGPDPILAVHDASYVTFLREAFGRWTSFAGSDAPLFPNVHPRGGSASKPDGIVGLAGWHTGDMACEITAGTWAAAYEAAQCAASAASLMIEDGRTTYALCRPPGHHAGPERAMGFCYLNNAAVCAELLRRQFTERVAILDVDVHHGNGTQDIFYGREDVFFASIHGHPSNYYPFYWGYPEQTGAGAGQGATLNVPYPVGSDDGPFLDALSAALDGIARFAPGALVLSLGTDASVHDPHGQHAVTNEGFGRMAERIAALRYPTVIVQEGGYPSPALGGLVADVLHAFA